MILLLGGFRIPKAIPKWSQNGPKMASNWTPWALLAAAWFILGAPWGLLAAKSAQGVPKRSPRGSKRHPRNHFGPDLGTHFEAQSIQKRAFRLHHGPMREAMKFVWHTPGSKQMLPTKRITMASLGTIARRQTNYVLGA